MTTLQPLYFSTSCLSGQPSFEARLAFFADHGLKSVELGSTDGYEPELRTILKRYPLHYTVHNYFPAPKDPFVLNLASSDSTIVQKSLDLANAALELASEIESPFYSYHAGFITDPTLQFRFENQPPPDKHAHFKSEALKRFADRTAQLADRAQKLGVRLAVENNVCVPRNIGALLLNTADEMVEFFKLLEHPNVGLLLDVAHLHVSNVTFKKSDDESLALLKPYLCMLHLSHNDGTRDSNHLIESNVSWAYEMVKKHKLNTLPAVFETYAESAEQLKAQAKLFRELES